MKQWWQDADLLVPDAWLDSFSRYRRKVPVLVSGGPALLLLCCPACSSAWLAPTGVPCRGCGTYSTQEQVEAYAFSRLKRGLATLQGVDGRPYLTKARGKRLK